MLTVSKCTLAVLGKWIFTTNQTSNPVFAFIPPPAGTWKWHLRKVLPPSERHSGRSLGCSSVPLWFVLAFLSLSVPQCSLLPFICPPCLVCPLIASHRSERLLPCGINKNHLQFMLNLMERNIVRCWETSVQKSGGHWMKQVNRCWKECEKKKLAFIYTCTLTRQCKVTSFYITLKVLWWFFFFWLLFVSSFTPPSFHCSPIFSFSFLLGCCVILTSEVPSALTGEAAGELGCIECQAAMFKTEGAGREDKKNPPPLPLEDFWQLFWFPQETLAAKGRIPSRERRFYLQKTATFTFNGTALHLSIPKQHPIALCPLGTQ